MQQIQQKINNCNTCGHLPKLTKVSIQIGNTPFIIVGESPAKDGWIQSNTAFYNTEGKLQASGKILHKLLQILGYSINDIYFTEMCKCIITDRKQLNVCSNNCRPFFIEQLQNIPCSIILTMGKFPTQALLQQKIKTFAAIVGKQVPITLNEKKYTVIPIYHPSPLNPKGYKENVPIFQKLKHLLEEDIY